LYMVVLPLLGLPAKAILMEYPPCFGYPMLTHPQKMSSGSFRLF